MKNLQKLANVIVGQKPNLEDIREQTAEKIISRDPNVIVRYLPDAVTLIPGVIIATVANGDSYYATVESLDALRQDPLLLANAELSSLELIDEGDVPLIEDRLDPYLSDLMSRFPDSSQVSSLNEPAFNLYLEAQIEQARLGYRNLRSGSVSFEQSTSEFNAALEKSGYLQAPIVDNRVEIVVTPYLG